MPKKYFEKIPFIGYAIDTTGELRIAVDILQRAKIRDVLLDNSLVFYTYDVKDGETPETIASKIYGWTGYHWIVLLTNNIVDPYFDWPMSYQNLIETIRTKYNTPTLDGVIFSQSNIHHYQDNFGNTVDETTYLNLPIANRQAVSFYDWELQENENKRHIKLLDANFVSQIDAEMNDIMKRATV